MTIAISDNQSEHECHTYYVHFYIIYKCDYVLARFHTLFSESVKQSI